MSYMRDADGHRLDDLKVKAAGVGSRYRPSDTYTGPVATDSPTVTTGIAADAAFNKTYQVAGTSLPADWPVDAYGDMAAVAGVWNARTSDTNIGSTTTYRFMSDGSDILMFLNATNSLGDLYIDGRPYPSNPITFAASTGFGTFGFQKLVFGSAATRLIELRTISGLVAVYSKNPYRLWKPPADSNPKIAVVGDSFVYPLVMNNASSGLVTVGPWLQGVYQRMNGPLGLTPVTTDGVGGTGYINGGVANTPYGEADRLAWLQTVDPDVIVVHGGGVNDKFDGETNAAIITAATAYFTTLRTNHPNARLVFVEGFIPPGFIPYMTNSDLTAIRTGVQTNLNAAGIDAYYLDVSTTRPPLFGTGYVTAANGTGNTDIYVGSDSFHPTIRGHEFIRAYLARKLAAVLADDGTLAGSLI